MTTMIARSHHTQWVGGCQGGCCNTKRVQRIAKKSAKLAEKKEWKNDIRKQNV